MTCSAYRLKVYSLFDGGLHFDEVYIYIYKASITLALTKDPCGSVERSPQAVLFFTPRINSPFSLSISLFLFSLISQQIFGFYPSLERKMNYYHGEEVKFAVFIYYVQFCFPSHNDFFNDKLIIMQSFSQFSFLGYVRQHFS